MTCPSDGERRLLADRCLLPSALIDPERTYEIAVIGFVYDDFITLGEDSWPVLFNQVYLAFDAGEVGPPGVDPIAVHTRPMIAKIVDDLADNAG